MFKTLGDVLRVSAIDRRGRLLGLEVAIVESYRCY